MSIRDEICGWTAIGLLLIAAALIARGLLRRARGPALFCPGPRPTWYEMLSPRRWFFRVGCWYNLTGLDTDADGVVRCPECGTRTQPQQRLCEGRRWRPATFGLLTLLPAIGAFLVPTIANGNWASAVPSPLLVSTEVLTRQWQPRPLRLEVRRRVLNASLDSFSTGLLCRFLARDLRDDDLKGNAERAEDLLGALWPDSQAALERCLSDSDRQARLIAASLLRDLVSAEPSDALLRACVEDLSDDEPLVLWWSLHNAQSAAGFLSQYPSRAAPLLRPALHSDNYQQRLLAAAVAGFASIRSLVDDAAPILIEQLRDDDISGNAKIAAPALVRFGPAVLPYLERVFDSEDSQQRGLVRAIAERVANPSESAAGKPEIPRITSLTLDPLGTLSIDDGIRDLP